MRVETTRFGAVEVPEDRVLTFPEGLPGFTGKRWVLIEEKKMPLTWWLHSADHPELAMLVVDPSNLPMPYAVTPKPAEIRPISPEGATGEKIVCRIVVRNGERPGEMCFNLFAPVFLNLDRRLGMQVPLVGSGYDVREIWPPRPEEAAKAEEDRA